MAVEERVLKDFERLVTGESEVAKLARKIQDSIRAGDQKETARLLEQLSSTALQLEQFARYISEEVQVVEREEFDIQEHLNGYIKSAKKSLDSAADYSKKKRDRE